MDKKELYERAEKALNQAFEAAKKSAKVVAEKAGEAANVTKLLVQKLNLEHQASKQFARLGSRVYEKAVRDGREVFLQDAEIRNLVEEARKLESELAQIEESLENEKKKNRAGKASGARLQ